MFARRKIGLALLLLAAPAALAPSVVSAQYFGQNKVQYRSFDFQVLATEHFDVYFYPTERAAALDMARMAERSYARLTRVLNYRFRERKPIILYASPSDFQQTNITDIGEGTQGVTDFFKQRNVIALQGSHFESEHVLTHEMVHQFQYDIFSRGRAGAGLQTVIAINPPLWFMEGMAEYLSLGPVDPNTAMWLRDAALEGRLPSIQQMETDPRIFPYRFGHGLWSYIGERWGDEAVGAILQGTLAGGIAGSIRRALGVTVEQLSAQWRDAVQKKYLPEIGDRVRARSVASELLTEKRSEGTLHLAPALSPDGSEVAYFSEKDFFFVDLYLADGVTGKVKRRLLKSTFSSNYETFRFLNSQASWSPDGQFLAFAGKRGPRDDIIILDVKRNKKVRSIPFELDGVTTPSWSPDGQQLVFTGYDGGLSDLFLVNRDGSNLRRLTNDKYAELHPTWSPDGKTIAFATDRGPKTDFQLLTFGDLRIALYDLASGQVKLLSHMDEGRNINPVWAPDGQSLAFVSDRNGVSNVYLYELAEDQVYQLTDFYTGVQGFTPLSPVVSWAAKADRLAFMYYEQGKYDVYTVANPRALKRGRYQPAPADSAPAIARGEPRPVPADTAARAADTAAVRDTTRANPNVGVGGSIYRTPRGFRSASEVARAPGDTMPPPEPVSIVALLDSATLALPDTSEFTIKPYRSSFTVDYVARPSIGYAGDNFGRGVFGGSAVQLSDVLGNRQMIFAGYVNGRIQEAQILAAYVNLSKRINWAAGISQDPYFFLEASEIQPGTPTSSENTFVTNVRRLIVRSVFTQASYPLSRFKRLELGARFVNVDDALLSILEPYSRATGFPTREASLVTDNRPGATFVQPSAAFVHDNTVFGWVGPMFGARYRFEVSQNVGNWKFTGATGDYRRYDAIVGPVVLASRLLYVGRVGRDANEFRFFAGHSDLIRGNTSGSYADHECRTTDPGTETGCVELDRLVGTQLGLASTELRFPILNPSMGFVPNGFPPIEGAIFYDIGLTWDNLSTLKWRREAGDDPLRVRTPLKTLGFSIRTNVFGFFIARLDYSIPQDRPGVGALWHLSLGPTF